MKTKEYSYVEFEEEVLANNAEIIEKATNLGVNVTEIITKIYEDNKEWEIDYTIPKVANWINGILELKSAVPVLGVVIGFTDVKGYNMPMSMALISTDKKNKELRIGWTPAIKKMDGSGNLNLMNPAMIEGLAIEKSYDNKGEIRKDWWLVDVTTQAPLTKDELVETLNDMGAIKAPDDLLKSKQGAVVATKITIGRIYNPSKRVGEESIGLPVWQRDDFKDKDAKIAKFAPVFTISATTEAGTSIRAYIGAPHLQRKYIAIDQIEDLCQEAIRETSEPAEQALYLEGMLRNRDVIIIGRIFAVDPEPTERNNGSVGLSVFGCIMLPRANRIQPKKQGKPQQTLPEDVASDEATSEEMTEEVVTKEPKPEEHEETTEQKTNNETIESEQSKDSISPVEAAVRENIIKVIHMRAQKPVKSTERAEWLGKITNDDLIKKFKIGDIVVDGKKKKVKLEIVEAILEDMRK
jgi:hypothetical protein